MFIHKQNRKDIAQLIFNHILTEASSRPFQCIGCLDDQPNQLAHYPGCLSPPRLSKEAIMSAICKFSQYHFSIDLWMAISQLIDEHNNQILDF